MKFHEGQQVWVVANLGGQIVRQKGIVLGASETEILAGSFATKTKNMEEYRLDGDGKGEHVWLEPRL
jgi:hypothetical protein